MWDPRNEPQTQILENCNPIGHGRTLKRRLPHQLSGSNLLPISVHGNWNNVSSFGKKSNELNPINKLGCIGPSHHGSTMDKRPTTKSAAQARSFHSFMGHVPYGYFNMRFRQGMKQTIYQYQWVTWITSTQDWYYPLVIQRSYWKSPCLTGINSLFLWPCSSIFHSNLLVITRG